MPNRTNLYVHRMHPHPTMLPEHLLSIVTRSFNSVPHNDNPAADDIITLYLQLPFEQTDEHGTPYICRSALISLLAKADEITGHNENGDVIDESKLANLLGAMGYLALIDQVARCSSGPTDTARWRPQHLSAS